MLKLVKPSHEYSAIFLKALNEYKTDTAKFGLDSMRQLIKTVEEGKFDEWLQKAKDNDLGLNLPEGYISNTKYWLLDNNEYIGSFTLRHDINENLMQWGGHIGYVILPSKRGHGYAFAGLKLVLAEAAKRGLKRVLITCNIENRVSFAVINKAKNMYGGEQIEDSHLEGFSEHRVWINTTKSFKSSENSPLF